MAGNSHRFFFLFSGGTFHVEHKKYPLTFLFMTFDITIKYFHFNILNESMEITNKIKNQIRVFCFTH